jgi:hypothetical protein
VERIRFSCKEQNYGKLGKLGFVQDCFGESFNVMIIGIDHGKCSFIQDCFGESFNVMIIGIDYGKLGFVQIGLEQDLIS